MRQIDTDKIVRAYRFAEKAHGPQTRADNWRLTIDHAHRVAMLVAMHGGDEVAVIAGFLHDTVEDTDATLGDIEREFGPEVANVVWALTDPPEWKGLPLDVRKPKQADRLARMRGDMRVYIVKLADQTDNLESIVNDKHDWPRERCVEYCNGAYIVACWCQTASSDLWERFAAAYHRAMDVYGPRSSEIVEQK